MSDDDNDICANCGWPAENCGLAYLSDGRLARSHQLHHKDLHIAHGCQVCYALQCSATNHHLLGLLEQRREQIESFREMVESIHKAADEAHRRLLAGYGA